MTPNYLKELAQTVSTTWNDELSSRVFNALLWAASQLETPGFLARVRGKSCSSISLEALTRQRLLIVEDSDWDLRSAVQVAEVLGWNSITMATSDNVPDALSLIESFKPTAVVADYGLGNQTGLEVLKAAVKRDPFTRCVLFTSSGDPALYPRAIEAGAALVVRKSIDMSHQWEILRAVFTSLSAGAVYANT